MASSVATLPSHATTPIRFPLSSTVLPPLEPGPFPVVSLYLNAQPDQHGRDHFEPFLRKELRRADSHLSGRRSRAREPRARMPDRSASMWRRRRRRSTASPSSRRAAPVLSRPIELAAPDRRAPAVHLEQPHLYPLARAARRISALRGAGGRHPRRAHLRRRREHGRGHRAGRGHQDAPAQDGRLVAGALPAPHRELPPAAREGSGRHADAASSATRASARSSSPATRWWCRCVSERAAEGHRRARRRRRQARHHTRREREIVDADDRRRCGRRTPKPIASASTRCSARYRADGLGRRRRRADASRRSSSDRSTSSSSPQLPTRSIRARRQRDATQDERSPEERAADELVAKARQTAATIRFIEDPALLAAVGGVGAFLRFKL